MRVCVDRNHYSKALVDKEDEIAELRKVRIWHQIEQLKEEIVRIKCSERHFELQKSEKLRETFKQAQQEEPADHYDTSSYITRRRDERRPPQSSRWMLKLLQRKEYDQVINGETS